MPDERKTSGLVPSNAFFCMFWYESKSRPRRLGLIKLTEHARRDRTSSSFLWPVWIGLCRTAFVIYEQRDSMSSQHPDAEAHAGELEYEAADEQGPEEIFLDDDDIAELQAQMDDQGDMPMDEDENDDDVIDVSEQDEHSDQPVQDTALRNFRSHGQPIFSISTHPTCPVLAVSGGEDDHGYLWRLDTGEELAKLTGHTDSVVTTGWSSDGELVATGGMDGRVRVWRRVKAATQGQWDWARWEFLTVLEGMDEITASEANEPRYERG